jgi:hypothetical protein
MKGKVALALIVALLLVVAVAIAVAHAVTETVTINGRANPKIVLTVDTDTITFAPEDPGVAQEKADVLNVNVRSNKAYTYEVTAPATWTGGSTPPISRLEWKRGAGAYAAFASGANDQDLASAKTGNSGFDRLYSLQLTWAYDDDPDVDYTADLVPTAVQNP